MKRQQGGYSTLGAIVLGLAAFLVMAVVVVTLSACGGGSDGQDGNQGIPGKDAATPVVSTPVTVLPAPVTVVAPVETPVPVPPKAHDSRGKHDEH